MDTVRRLRRIHRDMTWSIGVGGLAATLVFHDVLARMKDEPVWLGPRLTATCLIVAGLGVISSVILHFFMRPLLVQLMRENFAHQIAGVRHEP